nr:11627_t:CDS:2 [Entrophospora candida]
MTDFPEISSTLSSSTLTSNSASVDLLDPAADFLAREQAILGEDAAFAIDYSAFNDEFPPLENSDLNNNIINGGSSFEEEETEFIKHWREEQREVIARRDEESEEKKQETINKAREDIDKFYDEYNEKKARSHEENKKNEEQFFKERDDITSGTAWGRICKQVDLSTAQSKSGSKHVKDVSRFKELLLSLKKDEKAPGSGGY